MRNKRKYTTCVLSGFHCLQGGQGKPNLPWDIKLAYERLNCVCFTGNRFGAGTPPSDPGSVAASDMHTSSGREPSSNAGGGTEKLDLGAGFTPHQACLLDELLCHDKPKRTN